MIGSRSETRGCAAGGRELLQLYLDGELPEPRRARLAAHLEACARCRAALAMLAEDDQRIIAACPVAPALSPAASRALLERALAEARTRRATGFGLGLLAWGLAALLIGLGSGAAAWRHHPAVIARRDTDGSLSGGVWSSASSDETAPAPQPRPLGIHHRPAGPAHRSKVLHKLSHPAPKEKPAKAAPRPAPPAEDRPRHAIALGHRFIADRPGKQTVLPAPSERAAPSTAEASRQRAEQELPAELASADGAGDAAELSRPALDPQTCDALARQVVAAAEQGDLDAKARIVEALLPGDTAAPAPATTDPAPGGDAPGSAGLDPGNHPLALTAPAGEPPAAETNEPPAPPIAQLLVLATETPSPAPVLVSEAPDDAPGYARAIGVQPDAEGHLIWTQATATHEGKETQLALVTLDDDPAWDW